MKVVFLDRDGVINRYPGHGAYVTRVKDFHFLPGSREAIRRLTDGGYKTFVISNQAGVGRGVYSLDKLKAIDAKMVRGVKAASGRIRKSFYCTHRPDAGCDCRKPGIGLVKKALRSMNKTIRHARAAVFVGDTEGDIKTGHNAGCKTIFVLSGRDNRRHMRGWSVKPDHVARDLKGAVDIILYEDPHSPRDRRGRA